MLEAEGTFTLTGILRGGGVDCSRLDDKTYVANTTGIWMRVLKIGGHSLEHLSVYTFVIRML